MRTLKSSMKNIFATIFCFLMNLIPGKKFWTKVNAGMNAGVILGMNSGQAAYEKGNGVFEKKDYLVSDTLQKNTRYLREYINYLYEYVDHLAIIENSISGYDKKVSSVAFEDTG